MQLKPCTFTALPVAPLPWRTQGSIGAAAPVLFTAAAILGHDHPSQNRDEQLIREATNFSHPILVYND